MDAPSQIGWIICSTACWTILSLGLATVRGRVPPFFLGIETRLVGFAVYVPSRSFLLVLWNQLRLIPSKVTGVPPAVRFPGLFLICCHARSRLSSDAISGKISWYLLDSSFLFDAIAWMASVEPIPDSLRSGSLGTPAVAVRESDLSWLFIPLCVCKQLDRRKILLPGRASWR